MRENVYQGRMQGRGMQAREQGRPGEGAPYFGSARSNYGDLAYGGQLNEQGMDRDWMDRTSDEVSSWFGDEDAERRRLMDRRRDEIRDRRQRRQYYAGYPSGYAVRESGRTYGRRDWHNLLAGDVMTREVATVHPNDSVQYATRIMRDEDCGALPVVDRFGRMMGMITDRDVAMRLVADGYDASHASVAEAMTDEVFACHVNDPLESCMRSMSRHQIRRMPILNNREQVIGIVSQSDLSRHAVANRGMGERRAFSDVMCAVSEPTSDPYS